MSSAWRAVRRALGVTFTVYVASALSSLLAGLPALTEASRWLAGAPWAEPLRAEGIAALSGQLSAQSQAAGLTLALTLLLSPWLQMAWLSALAGAESTADALRDGVRYYLRALATSLWTFAAWAVPASACLALPWLTHRGLSSQPNDRLHDLAVLWSALPLACWTAYGWLWHDLARAYALTLPPRAAAWRALKRAPHRGLAAHWLGWSAAGVAALFLADAAAALLPEGLWSVPAVLFVQLGALGRATLRSRWLAAAVAHTRDSGAVP